MTNWEVYLNRLIKKLGTPYIETNEYKRLCYVIEREKYRKELWICFLCGIDFEPKWIPDIQRVYILENNK